MGCKVVGLGVSNGFDVFELHLKHNQSCFAIDSSTPTHSKWYHMSHLSQASMALVSGSSHFPQTDGFEVLFIGDRFLVLDLEKTESISPTYSGKDAVEIIY